MVHSEWSKMDDLFCKIPTSKHIEEKILKKKI